jgi:hypothetical protein
VAATKASANVKGSKMSFLQRVIAVATLLCVATFLHLFCCDWVSRPTSLDDTANGGGALTIVRFSSHAGIVGRSKESVSFDAICGVALPLLMVGAAGYLAVGARQSK